MRKNKMKTFTVNLIIVALVLTLVVYYPQYGAITKVQADQSGSKGWSYNGWQYRKAHNITLYQDSSINFYDVSDPWATIIGDPTNRHAFQPVHNTTIVEVNKVVDGANRKYLAYDSDALGSQIGLYYTDNLNESWIAYSGNPILGPTEYHFRWPSVAYVDGVFHMFVTDRTDGTLERWTSTDGIHYGFRENVQVGNNPWKNPFIWFNPNDNQWYLYTHDSSSTGEYFKVRHATNIEDLDNVSDTGFLSRSTPFGSPTVMYFGGKYWLLGEAQVGGIWKIVAYYSTVSPASGFLEVSNSPILSNDEACPMIFLDPNQTRTYLFSNRDSSNWYQKTREVYINEEPTVEMSNSHVVDYQIRLTAHYASGVDNGENVYLNGHSKVDFDDVRFTWFNSSSGYEVNCNYWIEELKTVDYAVFWVKIPEISSTTNNTIYIYYGRDNVVTTSNSDATFDFFDDFSNTLSKWTVVGGTWQIENGELSAETTAAPFGQRIRANNFSFGNHSVHVKVKWISGTYFEHGPYVRGQQPNEPANGYMTLLSTWGSDSGDRISKMSNRVETTIAGQGTTNPSKNVWYTFMFKLYGNILKSSIAPLYPIEITTTDNTFSSGTLCLFSWSGSSEHVHYDNLFVCKHVYPEPSHASWGNEETGEYIVIDQAFVSDERADVGSTQTIALHAKWNNNGSDITGGSIYINNTEYITNSTGWITLNVNSPFVGKDAWITTGVNCNGITTYMQTAQAPSIIWDRIKITEGDTTKETLTLGETATIWLRAIYEYDNTAFASTNGTLYLNGSPMTWSPTNTRWEYTYTATAIETATFTISGVYDDSQGLTTINDTVGTQTITVWSTPFSIISNSTITELTFNSTSKTLTFTVTGLTETTGYTNLTISNTLIGDINGLTIYLDENQISYTTTSTDYFWLIHFTYHHSTHKVIITLNSPNSAQSNETPFGTTTVFSVIALATLAISLLVLIRRRRRQHQN